MTHLSKKKVLVIVGTTASGKTKLAVQLAKKFNGEIISADSRQVYRGMDIGTGKDLKEYGKIPYYLIDVVSPRRQFTLADWLLAARKAINDIHDRGKLPIVCGGTGLYVKALIEGYVLPQSQRSNLKSKKLRQRLNRLSLAQLLKRLKSIDLETYKVIDKNNRRRVQRALEVYYEAGVPKSKIIGRKKPPYNFTILGVTHPPTILRHRIHARLNTRLRQGMIAEVKRLHRDGVSWRKLESFGLEYRYIAQYLQGKFTRKQMVFELEKAIYDFSRRQMTWFRKSDVVYWLNDIKSASEIVKKQTKKAAT